MTSIQAVVAASKLWLAFQSPNYDGAEEPADAVATYGWLSQKEFYLALLVALLGMLTLWMQHVSLRSSGRADANEFTKSSVLILVIISAMFTVVAGISDEDVAPVMGLFGTIVGYVIGARASNESKAAAKQPSDAAGEQKAEQ